MAERPELNHENQKSPAGKRLWVREPDERWSFWRRGALPTLALTGVLVYGMTAFAHKTEDQVRLNVAEDLAHHGLTWVQVSVAGQQVQLTGAAPSLEARKEAVDVVTNSKCRTWLGRLPCASSVSYDFQDGREDGATQHQDKSNGGESSRSTTAAPSEALAASAVVDVNPNAGAETAAPLPSGEDPSLGTQAGDVGSQGNFKILRRGDAVTLEGAVTASQKDALVTLARTHFPSTALVDRLDVGNGNAGLASPEWQKATTYAVELAARCEQGVIAVQQSALDVDCETQTVSAKEAFNAVLATRPPTLKEGLINVLALDEVKSCEEALVKLVNRSQIRFTTNSAKLLPTSRPLLREIAHQLDRCPGVVVVEGHTDAQGDREENVTLSLNRARAVVSGLVGLGVPAGRVRAEGFGPDQPLATNETATGRAQNRRIEFRVARTGKRGE